MITTTPLCQGRKQPLHPTAGLRERLGQWRRHHQLGWQEGGRREAAWKFRASVATSSEASAKEGTCSMGSITFDARDEAQRGNARGVGWAWGRCDEMG